MNKNKKKLKIILKNLKKVLKPHQIVFLIILLVGNTYAWFVYSNKVSSSIDAHVRAWNVLFQSGETVLSDYYNVNISEVYPGMGNYVDNLTIANESEIAASITYNILEARIFDEEYVTEEGRIDNHEQVQQDDMTSAELETMLATDYPFTITFSLSQANLSEIINDVTSSSIFTVNVQWPFESGDDEEDTYWGNKAYEYATDYPLEPSITLRVKIYVSQSNNNQNNQNNPPEPNEPEEPEEP